MPAVFCKVFLLAESQQLFRSISCWLRAESVAVPLLGSPMVASSSGSWFWKEVLAWATPAWATLLGQAHWVEHAVHNSLPERLFLAFLRAVSQSMVPAACHLFKDRRKVKSTLTSSRAWKCYKIFLWLKAEGLFRCSKRNQVLKEKMTREEGR